MKGSSASKPGNCARGSRASALQGSGERVHWRSRAEYSQLGGRRPSLVFLDVSFGGLRRRSDTLRQRRADGERESRKPLPCPQRYARRGDQTDGQETREVLNGARDSDA